MKVKGLFSLKFNRLIELCFPVGEDNEVDLIEEQSWLLKLCSLELRCLTVAKQKSQLTRFVKLMFDESDKPTCKS